MSGMAESVVGTVSEMWRYPVKSMQGERVETCAVTRRGMAGDRAYALVDVETGRLASAKRPRPWGRLMQCSASVVDAGDPPSVRITLPDGTSLPAGPGAADVLSRSLGRPVRVVSAAPQGAALEELWVEEKGPSLYGPVVGREGGQAVIDVAPALGAPPGTLFDFSAVHLVTSSTRWRRWRRCSPTVSTSAVSGRTWSSTTAPTTQPRFRRTIGSGAASGWDGS